MKKDIERKIREIEEQYEELKELMAITEYDDITGAWT